jgi:hypothetical protein
MTDTRSELTDILHQFSLESEKFSPELLKEYCKLYPEFASELRNFSVYWAADDRLPAIEGEADQEELDFVTKAMSKFQNAMYSSQQEPSVQPVVIVNALKAMQTTPRLDAGLKAKLARGKIQADTITRAFVKFISNATEIPFDAMHAYLTGTRATGALAYKSDGKPETTQQESLEEAIRASSLTDEEKEALLAFTRES